MDLNGNVMEFSGEPDPFSLKALRRIRVALAKVRWGLHDSLQMGHEPF